MTDTFQFLSSVLPEDGYPVVMYSKTPENKGPRFNNKAFDDVQAASDFIQAIDRKGGVAFFACATFEHRGDETDSGGFQVERKQTNVLKLKSFFGDIDIKKDESHHQAISEASRALLSFCSEHKLPAPTLVRSGRGLHFYWILSEAVSPDEWLPVAQAIKTELLEHGVKIDRSVSTDTARVLRPVGTQWRKEEPSRLVQLLHGMKDEDIHPLEFYADKFLSWDQRGTLSKAFEGVKPNNDLSGGMFAPHQCLADQVADKCAQMAQMRDTKGDVTYEHWRLGLGLLKYCEDTDVFAEAWSSEREATGHSQVDWQAKLESWGSNPPLCSSFNSANPGVCTKCPHWETIKSPTKLGITPAAKAETTKNEDGEETKNKLPPWNQIAGYKWDDAKSRMVAQRQVETATGTETQWIPFSDTKYWVKNYILKNGVATLLLQAMHERPGNKQKIDEHEIEYSTVGGGGRDLNSKLAGFMINDFSGNRQLARSYLTDYASYLKRAISEIQTYRQFGWYGDDKFLLGDKIIDPKGTQDVRLGAQAAIKAGTYDVSGDPRVWTDRVNHVYNRKNGEPYQFILMSALGSILVPLLGLEEFSGMPIAVTSDGSGYGKTTVCWVALAAFGAVRRGLNVLNGDDVSILAIEKQASVFNNIPYLLDEQTNRGGEFTSNMLYLLSNGTARARGRPDGELREMAPPWQGNSFITGNRNVLMKLTENRANPEAAQMRVFEISLDAYPRLETLNSAYEIAPLLNEIKSGYGGIATDFIQFVMANRQEITEALRGMPLTTFSKLNHDKERFYIYTASCTLMAAHIMRRRNMVNFDVDRLTKWTRNHIISLRGSVDEMRATPEDNLSRMLLSLSSRFLVTDYYSNKLERPVYPVRADIAGRIATKDRRLFITVAAASQWCIETGVQWHKFRAALIDEGFFGSAMRDPFTGSVSTSIRLDVSKGAEGYVTGSSRVIEINYSRVASIVESELTQQEDNVLPLRR